MKKKSPRVTRKWGSTEWLQTVFSPVKDEALTFIHLSFHPPPPPFVSLYTFIEKTLYHDRTLPPCSDIGQSNEARFVYVYMQCACCNLHVRVYALWHPSWRFPHLSVSQLTSRWKMSCGQLTPRLHLPIWHVDHHGVDSNTLNKVCLGLKGHVSPL